MQTFEVLILLTLVPFYISLFLPMQRRGGWLLWLPLVALILTLLHLGIEGHRWQMNPAYALTFFALLLAVRNWRKVRSEAASAERRSWLRLTGAASGCFIMLVAIALPIAFPVFDIPVPSGPHPVGTKSLTFVDSTRAEILTAAPDDLRKLVVQTWYPAEQRDDAHHAPYLENPPYIFNYWRLIRTASLADAPISGDSLKYPVLLYSHCYMCPVNQSTVLMQELASHGYAVFSISHPYEEVATVFPDGETVYGDFGRMTAVRKAFPAPGIYADINAATTLARKDSLFRAYLASAPLNDETVRLWSADTDFILKKLHWLQEMNAHDPFWMRLDLSRVGVVGYSMGGAVAGQVLLTNPAVDCGINIDCITFGDAIDQPLKKPVMFLASEAFTGINDVIFQRAQGPAYHVTIAGTTHQNFSDLSRQAPFIRYLSIPKFMAKSVGLRGPVVGKLAPARAGEIANACVLAFFDRHLRGQQTLLSQTKPALPEIEIKARNLDEKLTRQF